MKALLAATCLLLAACGGRRWQACAINSGSGEILCGTPQTRDGAELKALAINATAGGQAAAWSQRVQGDAGKLHGSSKPDKKEVR